ncbi:MAG TPA: DUF2155 domain-containing protein [Caulobacteraceae bacterium]|nr:DUF2155 domain-containing protein [Caulobacteraceae bacterium]
MSVLRSGLRLSLSLGAAAILAGAAAAQTPAAAQGDPIGQLLQTQPAHPAAAKPPPPAAPEASDDAESDQPAVRAAPPPPPTRTKRNAAIVQALDKVTAETLRFEADVNQPVRYKDLVFTVHACEDSASDETPAGAFAHLEIDFQPKPVPGQSAPPAMQLFKGWMFSNAPGVHPFQHPVYDAWLIACKTASPGS